MEKCQDNYESRISNSADEGRDCEHYSYENNIPKLFECCFKKIIETTSSVTSETTQSIIESQNNSIGNENNDESNTNWLIIGVCVGATVSIAVIAVIAGLGFLGCRLSKKKVEISPPFSFRHTQGNSTQNNDAEEMLEISLPFHFQHVNSGLRRCHNDTYQEDIETWRKLDCDMRDKQLRKLQHNLCVLFPKYSDRENWITKYKTKERIEEVRKLQSGMKDEISLAIFECIFSIPESIILLHKDFLGSQDQGKQLIRHDHDDVSPYAVSPCFTYERSKAFDSGYASIKKPSKQASNQSPGRSSGYDTDLSLPSTSRELSEPIYKEVPNNGRGQLTTRDSHNPSFTNGSLDEAFDQMGVDVPLPPFEAPPAPPNNISEINVESLVGENVHYDTSWEYSPASKLRDKFGRY